MPMIDAHAHVGSCMSAIHFSKRGYTVDELIKEMDKNRVNQAFVQGGGEPHDIRTMNQLALDAVQRYPDRLIGIVRVNPMFMDAVETFETFTCKHGFRGVKLHPTQDGYQLLDPRVHSFVSEVEKTRLPVMIHSGSVPYAMPGQVADLAVAHPASKIIMAHAGKLELWQHVLPSARRAVNIFLEFSFTHHVAVRRAIDALGPKRVLFGSNWPAGSMRPWIETMEAVDIFSEEEKALFLGENALSLLNDHI